MRGAGSLITSQSIFFFRNLFSRTKERSDFTHFYLQKIMFPKFISQFFQAAPSPSSHSGVNNIPTSSPSASAHQKTGASSLSQQGTQEPNTKMHPGAGESGAGTMEARIRAKIEELKKGSPMEIRGGSIEGLAKMIVQQETAQEEMAALRQQQLEKMNAPPSPSPQQFDVMARMKRDFGS